MESESAQASHVTVFVGGLPADTTEDDLVSLTSPDTHLCHRAWIPAKYDISKKASFGFIEVPKRIATKMLARKHYIRGRRDRKSTRLNSSHRNTSRMPSSA